MRTIRRHELITFFALAYGITWSAIGVFLWSRGFDFAGIGVAEVGIVFGAMALGPSTAGIGMTALTRGRSGLRELIGQMRHVRVAPRWYAIALLTTPLLLLAVLLPLSTWVSPGFAPGLLIVGIVAGLLAGAFEEIGWTGFATPRLLGRFSPLGTGLLLGLLWASWHTLADFTGNIATLGFGNWLVWMITYWIVPLTGYRVLMTWVYAHVRSLPLAMLMHASYTGWLATLSPAATGTDALLWHLLFSAGTWLLVGVFVMRSPVAWRRPAAAAAAA